LNVDGFDLPHEVPEVEIMAVVVAKHAPIVRLADQGIDVGEVVLRNPTLLRLPHFFPQSGSTPGPLQQDRFVYGLFPEGLPAGHLRHASMLAQMGHRMYHLLRRRKRKVTSGQTIRNFGGGGGSRTRVRESPP
jgi:hypothetical protein